MDDLEICPLTLTFAIADIGTWAPDPNCNMYGSMYNDLNCLQHAGAQHCVINLKPTLVVIYYYLIQIFGGALLFSRNSKFNYFLCEEPIHGFFFA